MELKVVGRLVKDLINNYKDVLEYSQNNNLKDIILFCDFSEFEIPKNYSFKSIQTHKNKRISACTIILKAISQQYVLPFESIPIGWKTVCKFEILEVENIELLKCLPEINEWSESDTFFILS